MKKTTAIFVTTALLLVTARGTSVVFDTFGPGDTYNRGDTGDGFIVGDIGGPITYGQGAQFTAGTTGDLETVYLGLTYFAGFSPLAVNVYLYGDVGNLPDTTNQIFLGTGSPTDVYATTNNSVVSFAVAGTVPVTMGTTYWLVLKPGAANEGDVWNAAFPIVPGIQAESINDSNWFAHYPYLPAFRLTASNVSSVPDSGNTLLLTLGALVPLLLFQRKFVYRQAIR